MKIDDLDVQRNLGDKELAIFNAEMQRHHRSTLISYLLLIFLGGLGAHKFYLGKVLWGIIYLILSIVGYVLFFGGFITAMADPTGVEAGASASALGILASAVIGILLLIDLFTLPLQVKRRNKKIRKQLLDKLTSSVSA